MSSRTSPPAGTGSGNLGTALVAAGQDDEAIVQYRKALDLGAPQVLESVRSRQLEERARRV